MHVALCPSASVTLLPDWVPPTHDHEPPVYPATDVSDNVYVPEFTLPLTPPAPEIGVGPAADNVKSVVTAVPPLSFVTVFTSVRCAV